MKFTVIIAHQAHEELDLAFARLLQHTQQHAPAWYGRVLASIDSLEHFPTRCPPAPESEEADEDVRHLIVGDHIHGYRIVFAIRGSTVVILDIIHGARESP